MADDTTTDQATIDAVRAIAPPPPAVPVPPPAIAAPGGRVVAPPVGYPGNAAAIGADTQFRSMVNRGGMPIAQAQQAVDAAFRFQAQRGYQNDLQSGMAPAAALAKWAPMLFGGVRGANLGQAASFIRATTPQRKVYNTATGLYALDPSGTSVTRLPGQSASIKAPPQPAGLAADIADARKTLNSYVTQIEKAEASDDKTLKKQLPTLRQRRKDLENYVQAKEILQGNPQSPSPAPQVTRDATTPPPASAPQTVTTKAQFDALAPGAVYFGKNGKRYRKPEARTQTSGEPADERIEPDER